MKADLVALDLQEKQRKMGGECSVGGGLSGFLGEWGTREGT